MKVYLTRLVRFCAAHRYHRPEWSEERNTEAFGACANDPGHGHNYQCFVTLAAAPDPQTSMVMPLDDLDSLLHKRVVERFDHDFINTAAPETFGPGKQIPTAEALAVFIWNDLAPHLPAGVALHCVRVQEDPTLFSEYRGEE